MRQCGEDGQCPGGCDSGSGRDQCECGCESQPRGSQNVDALQEAVHFLMETVTNVHEVLKNLDPKTLPCPPQPCSEMSPCYSERFGVPQYFASGSGAPHGYPLYFLPPQSALPRLGPPQMTPSQIVPLAVPRFSCSQLVPPQLAPPHLGPPQFSPLQPTSPQLSYPQYFYPPPFTSQSYCSQQFPGVHTSDSSTSRPDRPRSMVPETPLSTTSSATSSRRLRKSITFDTQTLNSKVSTRSPQHSPSSPSRPSRRPASPCASKTRLPCLSSVSPSESNTLCRRSSESCVSRRSKPCGSSSRPSTSCDTGVSKPSFPQFSSASSTPSRSGNICSTRFTFCIVPKDSPAEPCPSQPHNSRPRSSKTSKKHRRRSTTSCPPSPCRSERHRTPKSPRAHSSKTSIKHSRSSATCSVKALSSQSCLPKASSKHKTERSRRALKSRSEETSPPPTCSTPPCLSEPYKIRPRKSSSSPKLRSPKPSSPGPSKSFKVSSPASSFCCELKPEHMRPSLVLSKSSPQEPSNLEPCSLKSCSPSPRDSDLKLRSRPSSVSWSQKKYLLETYSPQPSRPLSFISECVATNSPRLTSSCSQSPSHFSSCSSKSLMTLSGRSSSFSSSQPSSPQPSSPKCRSSHSRPERSASKSSTTKSCPLKPCPSPPCPLQPCPPKSRSPPSDRPKPNPPKFVPCRSPPELSSPKSPPIKPCPFDIRPPPPCSIPSCPAKSRSTPKCPSASPSRPQPGPSQSCPPTIRPCPPPPPEPIAAKSSPISHRPLKRRRPKHSSLPPSPPEPCSTDHAIPSRSYSSSSVCGSPRTVSESPSQSSCPLSAALCRSCPPPPSPPTPPCLPSPCSPPFSAQLSRTCSARRSASSSVTCFPPPPLPPCPPSPSPCAPTPPSCPPPSPCIPSRSSASVCPRSPSHSRTRPCPTTAKARCPPRVTGQFAESRMFSKTPRGICVSSGVQDKSAPSFTGTLFSTPSRARPVTQRPASCITCDLAAIDLSEGCLARLGVELLQATEDGDLEKVKELLAEGVDVDFTSCDSELTPLHRAARRGNAKMVILLVEWGANIHALTRFGFTPLHIAAYNDFCAVTVSVLITAGSEVNQPARSGRTPLHYASEVGNAAAVQALLAAGARKDVRNCEGETPFDVAGSDQVRFLLCC